MTMATRVFVTSLLLSRAVSITTPQLTPETFESFKLSGKNGMIKFFQPWCGHCTRLKPEWDLLYEEAPSDVVIADVNCAEQRDLCAENGVDSYPTIIVYKNGAEERYTGARGFESLIEYVEEHLTTPCLIEKIQETCTLRERDYFYKWKQEGLCKIAIELTRLQDMVENCMKSTLKSWIRDRIKILQQLEEMLYEGATHIDL